MSKKTKVSLYWFRKALRLHDNPGLRATLEYGSKFDKNLVLPIFIFDPSFKILPDMKDMKNNILQISTESTFMCSHNRYYFLFSSLLDLDKSLKEIGSKLYVFYGNPATVFEELFGTLSKDSKEFTNFTTDPDSISLNFEFDTEPYSLKRDDTIKSICEKNKVSVNEFISHTLYDPRKFKSFFQSKPSTHPTYKMYLKELEKHGEPLKPDPSITKEDFEKNNCVSPDLNKFGKMEKFTNRNGKYEMYNTYEEFCDSKETIIVSKKFPGGEKEGLKRLTQKMSNKEWVRDFEKPNTSPNSLQPSTTVLSPYLKFGCVSVRTFYHEVKNVQKNFKKVSQPPESLIGQLLWREFFYNSAFTTPNFHKMEGNKRCKQINWDQNDEFFLAWANAKTGFPFIDAVMTQLREEGWIHHLARHSVACFLTRGHLYQSWEKGLRVFEQLLLDSDYSLNAANWQWLSASAFFYQYSRVYGPVSFGKKTDKSGDYIKKYLPILKDFPKEYIYEPWKAPLNVQKKAKCIIGVDYPLPIVDEESAKKSCLNKMSISYELNRESEESVKKKVKK